MRLSDFDYELPAELIAQQPTPRRRDSRLLVLDSASANVAHRTFPDIAEYLDPGDLVVVNDTRVIPARLFATKPTGGRVEILVERILAADRVLAWLRFSRAPNCGTVLSIDRGRGFVVRSRRGDLFELEVAGGDDVARLVEEAGAVPLPRTSAARRTTPTPSVIRRCTPAGRVRWRRLPPGCTSTKRCSQRSTTVASVLRG